MNTSGTSNSRRAALLAVTLTAASGAVLAMALPASAAPDDKVTLCHATGSATNPYVQITVSAAGAYNGHYLEHRDLGDGDIIPAFTFRGATYSATTPNAQAIVADGCQAPDDSGDVPPVYGYPGSGYGY